jgi:hypothetical protein
MEPSIYSDFATNPTNPYYLHPNENPAVVLVTPLLDRKNYHSWLRSMKIALLSKNKMKFVDGTLAQPRLSDPLYDPWIRCNSMVLSWIQRSISPDIAKSIIWFDHASAVWKDLEFRFAHGDMFKISDLQEEMLRLNQGSLDISSYYTQLKSIWEEIEIHRPVRDCTCAIPCSCGAVADMKKYHEQDCVLKFLKGLNEQYSHVRSQIMMMEPLPPIHKVFSLVLQQERNLPIFNNVDSQNEVGAMAMQVQPTGSDSHPSKNSNFSSGNRGRGRGRGNFGRGQYSTRYCTHCGGNNHVIDTCFVKHGFPPGYKSKGAQTNNEKSVNLASATNSDPSPVSSSSMVSSLNELQGQFKQFLNLFQQQAAPNSTPASVNSIVSNPVALNVTSSPTYGKHFVTWVLDSGATDHITHSMQYFISYHHIKSVPISLPNGNKVCANIAGSIQISPHIIIDNVLFVPQFNINLISVQRLAKSLDCHFVFHLDHCSILQCKLSINYR